MLALDLNSGPLAAAFRDNTIGALYELAKRAPGEAVTLEVGRQRVLVLQDIDHIRQVLRDTQGKYGKNFGAFSGLFGESRLTADGARWEFLQGLSQPHISAARPQAVVEASIRAFGQAAEDLLAAEGNGPVVADRAIDSATGRVVAEVAFGDHGIDLDHAIDDFRQVLRHGAPRTWNLGGVRLAETAEERAAYEAARRRIAAAVEAALVRAGRSDMVAAIDAGQANGADPVAEMASLLFAGYDTTSAAIGWGLFLLAADPGLQVRLRRRIRGELKGEPPSLESLERIEELQAFQSEVLRIFPPVPMLGRTALGPDRIGMAETHEGQPVVLSIIGMHHDRRHVPTPAEVRLDRESALPEGHMAFGAGRRGCAGSRIARVELATAFAVLIPALEVSLVDQARLQFDYVGSLRRLGGQRLRVRPAA